MTDKFLRLFDAYKDAVIAERDGTIVYKNPPAESMLPKSTESIILEDIFPSEIINFDGERASEVCRINGAPVSVVAVKAEGYTIFSLTPQDNTQIDTLQLLSNISGAIRDPVSSMSMASGLLFPRFEAMAEPKLNSYMSMLYHSYYKILRVSNNVDLLYQFLSGAVSFKPVNTDVTALCENLVSSVNHFFSRPGLTISFESSLPSCILAVEPEKIEMLLLNLFSNSLKYVREGGIIKLSLNKQGNFIILSLSDNGEGIAPDVLSAVWHRYRETAKRDDPKAGLGLGLTIVRHIAELHGGTALITSEEGNGTTVVVSLPAESKTEFKNNPPPYESPGMSRIYTELSDVLRYEDYSAIYMD